MLRFSANISTMFKEFPFLERFNAAQKNGFEVVELQNPFDYTATELQVAKANMKLDLVNLCLGPENMGCASRIGEDYTFIQTTNQLLDYHFRLGFDKVHIMAGIKNPSFSDEEHKEQMIRNLTQLVEFDYFENHNLMGLIEPICADVKQDYFLNSFDTAVEIVKEVGSDQVKLLLDVYHLHKITGDVKKNIEKYYPYSGHVQISQDPGRSEPFLKGGNIDYDYVFEFLEEKKHVGAIGLEYTPSGSTIESLEWIKKYSK